MSISQITFGAVVAAALVFGPASPAPRGPSLKLTADAYLADARMCRDAVLDVAVDAAVALQAKLKQF